MKQDNELDQLFRDASKVNGMEEIPSVFLADLNARLDALEKKRKKPVAFWWLIGVFLISLFAFGTSFLFTSDENKMIDRKEVNVVNTLGAKKAQQPNAPMNENKIVSSSNSSAERNNTKLVEKAISTSKGKTVVNILTQNLLSSNLNINTREVENLKSSEKTTKEPIKETIQSKIENEKNESIIENKIIEKIDSVISKDTVLINEIVETVERTKEKKKHSITKEIGFYSGVSGIISSFEIPSEIENNANLTVADYRERREREEISTTSWDFSVRMKWVINQISLQTGLDYFQWGEEIRYEYNSISGINRYGYLAVPINIGYTKTWNKFGVNPFAGVMLGYGMNRNGNYLQPDLNSIAQASAKKYLANYQLACEFFFLSESQFKLSFTPIFRGTFKEVVYTDVIRNRYMSIGLQLGISYNF